MSVVHVVGHPIHYRGRVIQRCAVCGEKLADSKGAMMVVDPGGSTLPFPTWPAGRLVRVEGGNPTFLTILEPTDQLPDDNCFTLVED